MGSLGEDMIKKRAMWLYPMAGGFNPSERWGHSACFSNGVLYIFGGCCGGLHFGDVLALDLKTMSWSAMATTGDQPGPRDSHSSVLIGEKMFVFGGTNGTRKVNDLHVLDLRTKKWARPRCRGAAPPPRESHSATAVGDGKVVVFGGSGEGEGKYLNDVHVLDLQSMAWSSPEVRGEVPAARDSHAAFSLGRRLFVYGGDCGDRYLGGVDVLDLDTFTWSRLEVQGPSPGVRAGHAIVNLGSKVYVIGGVGDKRYYGDVWVLDVEARHWCHVKVRGKETQGRFSHTASAAGSDIVIFGGCGEDERPLNELIILHLGSELRGGAACHIISGNWVQERRRFPRGTSDLKVAVPPAEPNFSLLPAGATTRTSLKRRRSGGEPTAEQEDHSLSLSQQSPRSDQEHPHTSTCPGRRCGVAGSPLLIGAEVRGMVDGAFDSGFLMTARVNGQIFRGVLFSPVAGVAAPPSPATRFPAPPVTSSMVAVAPPNAAAAPSDGSRRGAAQMPKTCPHRGFGDFGGLVLTLGNSVGGS